MSRRFAPLALILVAALAAGPALARGRKAPAPDGPPSAEMQAVHDLRVQIAATELHQALGLDASQEGQLAALIQEVQAERAAHRAEREARAPELQALLQDYLASVQKNGTPDPKVAQALEDFREANRPDRAERQQTRKDVRAQLLKILDDEQQQVLRSFRPSLAPEPPEGGPEGEMGPPPGERGPRGEMGPPPGDGMGPPPGELGRRGRGERREARMERGEMRHAHRLVREVLLSEQMLGLLQR